jgi:hypothetical protein
MNLTLFFKYPIELSIRSRLALVGKYSFQPSLFFGRVSFQPLNGHIPLCFSHKSLRYSIVISQPIFLLRSLYSARKINHLNGVNSSLRLAEIKLFKLPFGGWSSFLFKQEHDNPQKNLILPF